VVSSSRTINRVTVVKDVGCEDGNYFRWDPELRFVCHDNTKFLDNYRLVMEYTVPGRERIVKLLCVLGPNLGFDFRWVLGFFLFTTASRMALGPSQPPIQWVPGALSPGVKRLGREADHSPPSSAAVKE
jgi:hypothetical protein